MCKNCTMQYILWLLIELTALYTNDRKIDEVLVIVHIGMVFGLIGMITMQVNWLIR